MVNSRDDLEESRVDHQATELIGVRRLRECRQQREEESSDEHGCALRSGFGTSVEAARKSGSQLFIGHASYTKGASMIVAGLAHQAYAYLDRSTPDPRRLLTVRCLLESRPVEGVARNLQILGRPLARVPLHLSCTLQGLAEVLSCNGDVAATGPGLSSACDEVFRTPQAFAILYE